MLRRIALVAASLMLATGCNQVRTLIEPREYSGAYAIIEIDRARILEEQLDAVSDRMAEALRGASIRYNGRGSDGEAARIRLVDPAEAPAALQALAQIDTVALTAQADGLIEARLTQRARSTLIEQALLQSKEILEQRVDPLGVRALVQRSGAGRLIVRTNEATLPASLLRTLGQQGRLTFHMVREAPQAILDPEHLPAGTMLAPPYAEGSPELVAQRPSLTGESLTSANPSTDAQTGAWVLRFEFDDTGRTTFCRLTRAHTGERFAILLDGRVLTAPRINEPICGGMGQISGNFTAQTASELAILLGAGALPARFSIVEEGSGRR